MKSIDTKEIGKLPGRRINAGEQFRFRCHADLACFNRCCRNLNLFLYPYDLLLLKNQLQMTADAFIDAHVDVVLRPDNAFPDVLLRMRDDAERTCPFLTPQGCAVYPARPDTCRTFPIEKGLLYKAHSRSPETISLFRPPDFCLGQHEQMSWDLDAWSDDQAAGVHNQMTAEWAAIKRLFLKDPWGAEGPRGPKARMAFMAAYNMDRFRSFVFESSFLKRYRVKPALVRKLRRNERALLSFGFEWIKLFVWGMPSRQIRQR
ncbi:MAG: YkgJ family cysteine cluster protein [Desulfosarcinaceae bacterium]|nr:YkgJ family cysteine cluster protein [Desulfosarcinaceae bacterium]